MKLCRQLLGKHMKLHIRKYFILTIWLVFMFSNVQAQENSSSNIRWTGYAQNRLATDFHEQNSFAIRRAKLWLDGRAPIDGNWYCKVQGSFSAKNSGACVLQDVFAEYRGNVWQLRLGQMVPDFSLQRRQLDFLMPGVERSRIVTKMIPSAETGARDIGAMLKFNNALIHVSL